MPKRPWLRPRRRELPTSKSQQRPSRRSPQGSAGGNSVGFWEFGFCWDLDIGILDFPPSIINEAGYRRFFPFLTGRRALGLERGFAFGFARGRDFGFGRDLALGLGFAVGLGRVLDAVRAGFF